MSLRGAIQCSEMACRAVVFSNMQDQVICIDENPCCLFKPMSDYGWARLLISGVIRCRMQQLTKTCEWLFFGARLFPVDTYLRLLPADVVRLPELFNSVDTVEACHHRLPDRCSFTGMMTSSQSWPVVTSSDITWSANLARYAKIAYSTARFKK